VCTCVLYGWQPADSASTYQQQVSTFYNSRNGLPLDVVLTVAAAPDGSVYAAAVNGLARFADGRWNLVPGAPTSEIRALAANVHGTAFATGQGVYTVASGQARRSGSSPAGLVSLAPTAAGTIAATANEIVGDREFARVAGKQPGIRQIASGRHGTLAVAAANGLYEHTSREGWTRVLAEDGARSWAPTDVRSVIYSPSGDLCFASAQGGGCRHGAGWKLYGPEELPYNDLTSVGVAPDASLWFGSAIGAMRLSSGKWEYRQGLRWLPDDAVRSVAVTPDGAWFATARGVGQISTRPMTLADKARHFEAEIVKRHRRTEYGYVLGVNVANPGDSTAYTQTDSDNDGLWTSMYGAGEAFACGAGVKEACPRAAAAFKALQFLGTVTQGGSHPAPRGYVARTILPGDGPNPNVKDTPERDLKLRQTRDSLWKIMKPRWPLSADKKWFWKSDTSSDELDGHYFFYGVYYDLAASAEQKEQVRKHVAALTDHLIQHNFQLVDHDGKATRWGIFDPPSLNRDMAWWEERGLNSLSILSYLKTAEHITGDAKYGAAAQLLRDRKAYDTNTLIPKSHAGAGAGNQSDDEMAFMCLYNLMRYETDERLRSMYGFALRRRWEMEQPELNPLFNYIAAASLRDLGFRGSHRTIDLHPDFSLWQPQSLDTLRRYPLDRFNWGFRNSHRSDVVRLSPFISDEEARRGYLKGGAVLPIDERFVEHWNHDPWRLDSGGDGRRLADGASFLLPYYMGLYHGFVNK
ncbi:MAG TPA: hypothetical protein VES20_01700, partial [Bryobacteraceae bacterium]|nr:hypothetical protein [Bryobacteraceae bacterium]